MAINPTFSGYYHAHSAIFGNSLEVGNGSTLGVVYTTSVGGTTANYLLNGSRAVFNLPPGSTVIFAELVLASQSITPGPSINFKTPVTSTTLPYGTLDTNGWVAYHQDITSLVSAGGAGTYEVGAVNGSVTSLAWFIYVIYTNPTFSFKYMYYTRGVIPVSYTNSPITAVLNNVYTPSQGAVDGYILMASTGGDIIDNATIALNSTLLGNTSNPWNGLAPYNPQNDIQAGIICIADTSNSNIGLLDTSGTFGTANNNPYLQTSPNPNRAWVDITGLDASDALTNNLTTVTLTMTTQTISASGYFVNIIGLEILAVISPTKYVDKSFATVGDTLTYTITVLNTETIPYTNVVLIDTLPSGTTFVPNSLNVNGSPISGNPAPPSGVNIGSLPGSTTISGGSIPVGNTSTITFQAIVSSTIPTPNPVKNSAYLTFNVGTTPQSFTSNIVSTTIATAILSSSKLAKSYANIGDVITYTIPIINTGNTTAINIRFIDTIPNGTTLVAGSIRQDSTVVAGSPNPPGVTLPNPIRNGVTSTVTFQVRVITLPSPNPIPNYASMIFQYTIDNSTVPNILGSGSSNTNIANTFINRADLSNITKSTDKDFATINDVITY
ncbi:DUF11 domain-containing protein, partial [Romboutsia sp.]|uniref:DUF11 domain-containing protein n=1 Tax=Romboutsia sp. TaxID=1965302 RepID=UPI003F2B8732